MPKAACRFADLLQRRAVSQGESNGFGSAVLRNELAHLLARIFRRGWLSSQRRKHDDNDYHPMCGSQCETGEKRPQGPPESPSSVMPHLETTSLIREIVFAGRKTTGPPHPAGRSLRETRPSAAAGALCGEGSPRAPLSPPRGGRGFIEAPPLHCRSAVADVDSAPRGGHEEPSGSASSKRLITSRRGSGDSRVCRCDR